LSAVELAVSSRTYVGQVDAEKLAQRSSVAVGAAVESKQMSLGLSQQKAEVVCESPEWAIGGDRTLGDQG
jgi:hypothetical protein